MRRGKLNAQQKLCNPVKQHTPPERLALRRKKRKEGPSGKRRAERRAADASVRAKAQMHSEMRAIATVHEDMVMNGDSTIGVPSGLLNPDDDVKMAEAAGVEVSHGE